MAAAAKLDVYKEWLGIPEGPRPPDHYALLRLVQFEDDVDKIRKHYKKLNGHVRKYATGQYSNESQELLNELAKAMLCLTDAERKLEYDREQGRVIDDRDPTTGRRPMTAYLQDEGLITAAQVAEIKTQSERTGLSVRDVVVQMKLADHETATRAYASEIGVAYVDLSDMVPDEEALDGCPKSVVRRYTCLPLFIDGERILVACANEPGMELEEEFRLRFGRPMRAVMASPKAIKAAIDQYYAEGMRKERAVAAAKPKKETAASKLVEKVTTKKPKSQMTDEEFAERRKLGIILICMTFVLLGNLDTFLFYDMFWKGFAPQAFPYVSTVLVGVPVMVGIFFGFLKR
jgi:hypothetical protein